MSDPRYWTTPTWRRIDRDDPNFRLVATYSWVENARRKGATVEVKTIHEYLEAHIADVLVDGRSYLLGTVQLDGGWHHVVAWRESDFSGVPQSPPEGGLN